MGAQEPVVVHKGLENVYVCESNICFIDGENSRLLYRGYSVEDLVENSFYEEVAYLLLYGRLPKREELSSFVESLRQSYELPKVMLDLLKQFPKNAHPMDVLRTGVSMLSFFDNSSDDYSRALRIIGAMPTIVASFARARKGLELVAPKKELSIATNFLYMLNGNEPDEEDARAMDIAYIVHAEHEMNASTFSCIVTASTLSDLYSVVTSGIATLKGPLHGGANERALEYFLSVGSPEKAEEAVEKTLNAKQRLMGFGHRVYKNYDPRYKILKPLAKALSEKKGKAWVYKTAEAVEQAALKRLSEHKIFPNVDFYSGILFHALGIETDLFTPIFAMSRSVGWIAHALEYVQNNRLIRPKAYYTGELNKKYTPIDQR
ncbi:citrate synthase [Candidatus Marsarchaeota G1 archaeon OSP_D]|jgi:citrate synthase (EC 2.3.3.1)|uniref:Citrate synthase n=2 Tax=Candidatus Marsarchaeota group 1 TaxID=2203770 RepID=A0A2R6A900_9ARCH|nr:MAG: citrate synthase [Candidatus Marsarchaeota G1 archaeon OSP_D]PSN87529.1 MAG: citrate synthase [Candidatus Marsarchaeota G1 archaeon OSP_C]